MSPLPPNTDTSTSTILPPTRPTLAYIFVFLTMVLHAGDTTIQWRNNKHRSKPHLIMWIITLCILFVFEVGTMVYIELERERGGKGYLPALLMVIEISTFLSLSIEAMVLYRVSRILSPRAKAILYLTTLLVLLTDTLAFTFLLINYHPTIALILQALGNAITHGFTAASIVYHLVFIREIFIEGKMELGKTVGAVGCAVVGFAAAGAAAGLLGWKLKEGGEGFLVGQLILAFIPAIPWILLQAYKYWEAAEAALKAQPATPTTRSFPIPMGRMESRWSEDGEGENVNGPMQLWI